MRCTLFLCAIAVNLWSAAVATSQAPTPGALSAELHAHLRDERLQIVTSIRGLPLGVRGALQDMFGGRTLDIAEPGADFQSGGLRNSTLPIRRLVAAGCSYDHCLVYYERGGNSPTARVALFHWAPDETRFEWGGTAPGGLVTIDEVRSAILAGTIEGSTGPW